MTRRWTVTDRGTLDAEHANGAEYIAQGAEVVEVAGEHRITALRCTGHHDGVDRARTLALFRERLTRDESKLGRQRLEVERIGNLTSGRPSLAAPPLDENRRRHGDAFATSGSGFHKSENTTLASFECDERACI